MKRKSATAVAEVGPLSLDDLKPLLPDLSRGLVPSGALRVRGITADVAEVRDGMIFVQTVEDAAALEQAVRAGAVAIVSEGAPQPECRLPWLRVQDALRVLGHVASRFAAEPSRRLEVSVFAGDSLRSDMRNAAALIHVRDDGAMVEERIARDSRSLGSVSLQQRMAKHASNHGRSVLLECRAVDLICGRLEGVTMAAAVIGLSEHALQADVEVAECVLRRLPADAVALLEVGNPFTPRLALTTAALVVTWGFNAAADVRATVLRRDRRGALLQVQTPVGACELELAALDENSQRAALAALAHAAVMGMAPERAAARLQRKVASSEALERMPLPEGFDVWTTQARSREGLARALVGMHAFTSGRVLLVPPHLAETASERAEQIFATLDAAERGDGVLLVLEGSGEAERSCVREWFLRGLTDVA